MADPRKPTYPIPRVPVDRESAGSILVARLLCAPVSLVTITVRFFASLRDRVGHRELALELADHACVRDLLARLAERFPLLSDRLPLARVAVNEEYAALEAALRDGDQVALLPPVSGGARV